MTPPESHKSSSPVCPGCGKRHPWEAAKVWGLLSIRCPESPTGYVYVEVRD